jgi:hypothetical protein
MVHNALPHSAHPELTGTPAQTGTPDIDTRQRSQSTPTARRC